MTDMPPLACSPAGLRRASAISPGRFRKRCWRSPVSRSLRTSFGSLRRERVSRVVICAGYLAGQIQAFVGDGSRFGVPVTYRIDGPRLLGTGGALRAPCPNSATSFL